MIWHGVTPSRPRSQLNGVIFALQVRLSTTSGARAVGDMHLMRSHHNFWCARQSLGSPFEYNSGPTTVS